MGTIAQERLAPNVSGVPDDEFSSPLTGLVGEDLSRKLTNGRRVVASVVSGARQAMELLNRPSDGKSKGLRPVTDGELFEKLTFVDNAFGGYEGMGPDEKVRKLDSLQRWAEGGNETEDQASVKILANEAAKRFMGYPTKNWAELMIETVHGR